MCLWGNCYYPDLFQVCVDVFITTQTYIDIASISVIPRTTGGQVSWLSDHWALCVCMRGCICVCELLVSKKQLEVSQICLDRRTLCVAYYDYCLWSFCSNVYVDKNTTVEVFMISIFYPLCWRELACVARVSRKFLNGRLPQVVFGFRLV